MKIPKKIASLFCVLVLFATMLSVGASALKSSEIKGLGSDAYTYKFTVKTGSRLGSNYVKLEQTKGTAPYKSFLTIVGDEFTDDDTSSKDANLYGEYTITVYDSSGKKVKSYAWNCTHESDRIKLGDNSTYTIVIAPWSVESVFCMYIEKWLPNALRYTKECHDYDGTWSSAPEWSIKTSKGIKEYVNFSAEERNS